MLISFCIPVHNRTYDLKQTMPHLIEAAEASPPVEIVVIDYNSPDDLAEYIETVEGPVTYAKYTGRDHYHMAHARNLSVMAASGEFIVILSADIYPAVEFVGIVRVMIDAGYIWMHGEQYTGAIVCRRQEFIDAGGYDERFEFYGPEDNDLNARLERRGAAFGWIPPDLLRVIRTPDAEKIQNYRLPLSKAEMHTQMVAIYNENRRRGDLVANEGQEWGRW